MVDGKGPYHGGACPLTGANYALMYLDVCTLLGGEKPTKQHTTLDWYTCIAELDASSASP